MNINKEYTSKKVAGKAFFNILFQGIPISFALILIPTLLELMGKDLWAKYSIGISLVFLANYFSFGLGPALNRRVSELVGRNMLPLTMDELEKSRKLSFTLGVSFFVLMQFLLYFAFWLKIFSVLQSWEDYYFFSVALFTFLVVFLSIPYRSILESFSDFYFLAIQRAITASMLFLVPFVVIKLTSRISLVMISFVLLGYYILLYWVLLFRIGKRFLKSDIKLKMWTLKIWNTSFFDLDKGFLKETLYFALFFISNAIVLFFDRFFYSLFFDSKLLADHVTLLDLFNRIAIIPSTLSLVYFSAISVWYQQEKITKIKKTLIFQILVVGVLFLLIALVGNFILLDVIQWWLGDSYSPFIANNSVNLMWACLLINFPILLIRPIQAIGYVREASFILLITTFLYVLLVIVIGNIKKIEWHFMALFFKSITDIIVLYLYLKRKKIF